MSPARASQVYRLLELILISRPPWLVFVTNHGKDVRFLGTRSISAEGRKLFSFMSYRNWESLTTWKPVPF